MFGEKCPVGACGINAFSLPDSTVTGIYCTFFWRLALDTGLYNGAADHFSHEVQSLIFMGPTGVDWHSNRGTNQTALFDEDGYYSTIAFTDKVLDIVDNHDTSQVTSVPSLNCCVWNSNVPKYSCFLVFRLSCDHKQKRKMCAKWHLSTSLLFLFCFVDGRDKKRDFANLTVVERVSVQTRLCCTSATVPVPAVPSDALAAPGAGWVPRSVPRHWGWCPQILRRYRHLPLNPNISMDNTNSPIIQVLCKSHYHLSCVNLPISI